MVKGCIKYVCTKVAAMIAKVIELTHSPNSERGFKLLPALCLVTVA